MSRMNLIPALTVCLTAIGAVSAQTSAIADRTTGENTITLRLSLHNPATGKVDATGTRGSIPLWPTGDPVPTVSTLDSGIGEDGLLLAAVFDFSSLDAVVSPEFIYGFSPEVADYGTEFEITPGLDGLNFAEREGRHFLLNTAQSETEYFNNADIDGNRILDDSHRERNLSSVLLATEFGTIAVCFSVAGLGVIGVVLARRQDRWKRLHSIQRFRS